MTTLYRLYDGSGSLLYVGIAEKWTGRLGQHCSDKPWFGQVSTVKVETYADRQTAMNAEREAIRSERPQHNVVHNRGSAKGSRGRNPNAVRWLCWKCGQAIKNGDGFVQCGRGGGSWLATCRACDPDGDNAYWFDVARARTLAQIASWTVHLDEKDWFSRGDWFDLLRRQAGLDARQVDFIIDTARRILLARCRA